MVTLFDGFRIAANALKANATSLAVSQQNLTHVGVKGYARQELAGLSAKGGGSLDPVVRSARSDYAEQTVWSRNAQTGYYEAFQQSANGVDELLGLGASGIQDSIATLFKSFSALQFNSGSATHQEAVIQQARSMALTISQTAEFLKNSAASSQVRIEQTVLKINDLVSTVQKWNADVARGGETGPSAEAALYANLQDLSELAPITAQRAPDGSLTLLLNGQTLLLQGTNQFPLQVSLAAPDEDAEFPDGPSALRILAADGTDITGNIQGGQLAGLLDYNNRFLPTLFGDATQAGALNRFAKSFADSVNAALGGSQPLFEYGDDPLDAARTLRVAEEFDTTDLADALSADPEAFSRLAQIVSGTNEADRIDGKTYSDFLLTLVSSVASEFGDVERGLDLQKNLLDQAVSLREQIQGATLEEEAVEVLEYQRAYQAAARMITVIDELTQTTLGLAR